MRWPLLFLVCLLAMTRANAQSSGIQFGFYTFHPVIKEQSNEFVAYNFSYHHDMSEYFGFALELSSLPKEYTEFIYSARYFTTNNKYSSFYAGSFLGYQTINGGSDAGIKQFPLGVALGYRGGLRGYFAEIYGRLGYSIGGGQEINGGDDSDYNVSETTPLYVFVGVAFLGFGWDRK
jgi:hypothetical protein